MTNIYEKHLEGLQKISTKGDALVSIFVPLRWADSRPELTLSTLVDTANSLLKKEGYPTLSLSKIEWEKWKKQGTNTLAIYQGEGMTNVIPLPIKMNPRVVVASTFHVKPLVASSKGHLEGLVLHFNKSGASLFRVNHNSETLIDSYIPSRERVREDWPVSLDKADIKEFLDFLKLEIGGIKNKSTKFLAITGSDHRILQVKGFWDECKLPLVFVEDTFMNVVPQKAISIVRLHLESKTKEEYGSHVSRIVNSSLNQSASSLETLGKKILDREIKSLCVSLEDVHFGELNMLTGEVVIRRSQKNTKDDDVLDDLLELALKNGVNVSVVPRAYLPEGRTFISA
jgi:hypothetical protein